MVDVGYNSFGIHSTTLDSLGFPGGGVHIFSATLDPIVHLTPRSHFDLYVIGGGVYHRNQDFTAPTVSTLTGFDPFFGFYPVAVQTTEILQSYSVTKPGVDISAHRLDPGYLWLPLVGADHRASLIAEGRHRINFRSPPRRQITREQSDGG
jgi:hypothetical protein